MNKNYILYFNPAIKDVFEYDGESKISKGDKDIISRFFHNKEEVLKYIKLIGKERSGRILIHDSLIMDIDKNSLSFIEKVRELDKKIRIVMSMGSDRGVMDEETRKDLFKNITPREFMTYCLQGFIDHSIGKLYIDDLLKNLEERTNLKIADYKNHINRLLSLKTSFVQSDELLSFHSSDSYNIVPFAQTEYDEDKIFISSLLLKYFLRDHQPKLCVLVAPSGFGKSTLAEQMEYLGVRALPKVTTRPYRSIAEQLSGKIISLHPAEFRECEKKGLIIAAHMYNKHRYGVRKRDMEELNSCKDTYILDMCNVEPAFELKKENPANISLVALFPEMTAGEFGLEDRINKLRNPSDGFSSFQEEFEYIKRSKVAVSDSESRLLNSIKDAKMFMQNLGYFDLVLRSRNISINTLLLLDFISQKT